MSRVIPANSIVIATLMRGSDDVPFPGTFTWYWGMPIGPGAMTSSLMGVLPLLLEHFPERLSRGAPVSLSLHVFVNDKMSVLAAHYPIKEPIASIDLAAGVILESVPEFIDRLFARLPQFFAGTPFEGAPKANAPTSDTAQ